MHLHNFLLTSCIAHFINHLQIVMYINGSIDTTSQLCAYFNIRFLCTLLYCNLILLLLLMKSISIHSFIHYAQINYCVSLSVHWSWFF